MKIKIILTGATGMVGEGILLECLSNPLIEKILVVGRRSCGYIHPKITEHITEDLMRISPSDTLKGFDSCFFCAGVSVIGKSEKEYTKITYDMTINFAGIFSAENSGRNISFCYVSGYGTNSTERGKSMWARVKGKTENGLIEMFGKDAYMLRPGYMKPIKGQKRIVPAYTGWRISYPVMKILLPNFTCSLVDLGKAMINCSALGFYKNILEVPDIKEASVIKPEISVKS